MNKQAFVPCDCDAPKRCPVETGDGRWYTREWKPGERERYKETVLRKPREDVGVLST